MPRSARYATARGPSGPGARCSERPPTAVPEGHTIHRLARDLLADLGGRTVRASSPQGRFVEGAARIDGATVVDTEAWGKHLFVELGIGEVLHIHLGLIGKLRRQASPPEDPVGQVRLRLEGEAATWDLGGPLICAVVTPDALEPLAASLGPDPLRRAAGTARLVPRVPPRQTTRAERREVRDEGAQTCRSRGSPS